MMRTYTNLKVRSRQWFSRRAASTTEFFQDVWRPSVIAEHWRDSNGFWKWQTLGWALISISSIGIGISYLPSSNVPVLLPKGLEIVADGLPGGITTSAILWIVAGVLGMIGALHCVNHPQGFPGIIAMWVMHLFWGVAYMVAYFAGADRSSITGSGYLKNALMLAMLSGGAYYAARQERRVKELELVVAKLQYPTALGVAPDER